jgi:rhodanese-related sulfurtransferase
MTKVSIEELKGRIDEGRETTVVDARSDEAWGDAEKKAGGAIRIPPDAAEKHINDVSRDDYIVTYCTCPNEGSSTRVAEVLEENGYGEVHPLVGGFDAWRAAELPLEPK